MPWLADAVAEWTLDQHNRLAPPPVTFMDWRREELPGGGWVFTDELRKRYGRWGKTVEGAPSMPGKLTASFLGKGAKRDREQVKGKRTRG
ncbi:MAG: hypothetical protein F4226_08580 [Synechococcus sp. SB0678_bin_12]|nr:hypothetical protein [Cyanobacteria bacterium MAG IRC1_bin_28]MYF36814.1 hypothetical protein [Synechococcus sp. SB0678_bin_12]MYI87510.1 hypothetical protein [Synechococcus sp. SB0672_bin_10]